MSDFSLLSKFARKIFLQEYLNNEDCAQKLRDVVKLKKTIHRGNLYKV